MTNGTKGLQVLLYVLATLGMVLDVMQLQVPGIRWVPFIVRPISLLALVPVTPQHFPAYIVGNMPVMFRTLPIGLQHVHFDSQVGTARRLCRYRPTELRAQFAHAPRPLRLVPGDIAQFFTGDAVPEGSKS